MYQISTVWEKNQTLFSGKIYTFGKKFYTTANRDGRGKSQLFVHVFSIWGAMRLFYIWPPCRHLFCRQKFKKITITQPIVLLANMQTAYPIL